MLRAEHKYPYEECAILGQKCEILESISILMCLFRQFCPNYKDEVATVSEAISVH